VGNIWPWVPEQQESLDPVQSSILEYVKIVTHEKKRKCSWHL
jgi:hypothetical protein